MTTHIDIPLSKLKLSPTNVRTDPGDVRTLARSIQSIGLINPLAVTKNGRGWLVEAGGRRLAALQLLRDNGHFAKDEPIPCRVFDSPSVARSLAENHERAPMDAVEQFQAFDRLIGEGHSVHEVAETFSVTVQFVRQRVKLAELAPEVIAAYRQGRVNLQQMAALTFGTHAQQIAIVAEPRVPGAYELRERLRGKVIRADDSRLKLIGIEAYRNAGGRTITDLFASTEDVVDEDVLDQLVREELLREAQTAQADGAAFAEVVDYGQQFYSSTLYVDPPADFEPTDEQRAEIDRLTAAITEARDAIDAANDALDQAPDEDQEGLRNELRHMRARFRDMGDQQDKLIDTCMIPKTDIPVGTIIALDYQGTIRTRKVCRAADVKHLSTTPAPGSAGTTGTTTPSEPAGREDLTAKGAQDIAQHRQAGLALLLSGWPQFTLALVVQAWDFAIFGGISGHQHGGPNAWQRPTPWLGDLRECPTPRPPELTEKLRAITVTPANDRRRPYRADMPNGHIPISWYIEQPKRVLLDILAHCVAHALCDPDSSDGKGHCIPATARETIATLVTASDFDLANYWQPTPEWLKGYGKAKTLAALADAGVTGDQLDAFKAQKATELYTAAAPVLTEKRWLPEFGKAGEA